jgi:hypothetical protein
MYVQNIRQNNNSVILIFIYLEGYAKNKGLGPKGSRHSRGLICLEFLHEHNSGLLGMFPNTLICHTFEEFLACINVPILS